MLLRQSSLDASFPVIGEVEGDEDRVQLLRQYHHLSASESEIFELLTPPKAGNEQHFNQEPTEP